LPLPSPVITYVSSDNFAGEGGLIIRGTTEKNFLVSVIIRDSNKSIAASGTASANSSGGWEILIDQPLKKGVYHAEAVSQDARGARSFPVLSGPFRVRVAPLLTIAGIGITPAWFAIGLLILVLIAASFGWLSNRLWRTQLGRRVTIAGRDVAVVFGVLKKDLDDLSSKFKDKTISESEAAEIEFLLKKSKDDLEKMGKYVTKGIQEISD